VYCVGSQREYAPDKLWKLWGKSKRRRKKEILISAPDEINPVNA
jgi:hypothetical protein